MKKFAVFDFDGTLIRWQLYHSIFDQLKNINRIENQGLENVRQARLLWKTRTSENSYKNYENALIEVFDKAITKIDYSVYEEMTEEVFQEHRDQVYTYTRGLIKELKDKGYMLFAISGSPREVVEKVAKYWGFDDWIASEYEVENNKITGTKKFGFINKDKSVDYFVDKYNLSYKESYGVGDSESDIKMLKKVEKPIAFNPSKELFVYACKNHWEIAVERKNVVYELKYKNGEYSLLDKS
ncbi:MAG TPA: HAD family phosphatase [Candidatus Saccharimonadales bacterium]|nr:HAD family phosphatase [Candidatus Saccharimonadales bacterium]